MGSLYVLCYRLITHLRLGSHTLSVASVAQLYNTWGYMVSAVPLFMYRCMGFSTGCAMSARLYKNYVMLVGVQRLKLERSVHYFE